MTLAISQSYKASSGRNISLETRPKVSFRNGTPGVLENVKIFTGCTDPKSCELVRHCGMEIERTVKRLVGETEIMKGDLSPLVIYPLIRGSIVPMTLTGKEKNIFRKFNFYTGERCSRKNDELCRYLAINFLREMISNNSADALYMESRGGHPPSMIIPCEKDGEPYFSRYIVAHEFFHLVQNHNKIRNREAIERLEGCTEFLSYMMLLKVGGIDRPLWLKSNEEDNSSWTKQMGDYKHTGNYSNLTPYQRSSVTVHCNIMFGWKTVREVSSYCLKDVVSTDFRVSPNKCRRYFDNNSRQTIISDAGSYVRYGMNFV